MKANRKFFTLTPLCALLLAAGAAHATDGYFPIGYGMKAKGMGGVSLTQTDNAFAGANNPAIAAFAGNRRDYSFSKTASGLTVRAANGDVDTLSSIERASEACVERDLMRGTNTATMAA